MLPTHRLVKTEGETVTRREAYTVVHTLIKVEGEALVYTQAHRFAQMKANSVTEKLRGYLM